MIDRFSMKRPTIASLAAVASLAFAAAVPGAAGAQPNAPSPETAEDEARTLFGEAKDLRAEGKWREACDKFKQAHETFPTGGTTFAMADCADRDGDLAAARALYQKVLDDPSNKDNAERITIATNRVAEIDKELAASKPHEPPKSEPKPDAKRSHGAPPTDAPRKANLVPGAIVLGAGGAVLIVGGVLGGVALGKANDVKAACKGKVCPADQESPAKTAKNLALGADVSFGVGAAAAVVGVVMMATMKAPAKGSTVEPTANGFLVRF
jgi:hypothetical protein